MTYIFSNATNTDVAVFRVGLNYLLFETFIGNSELCYEDDLNMFLRDIPSYFSGKIVFLLMSPVLKQNQVKGLCTGEGFWDSIMWDINPKIVRLNNILRAQVHKFSYSIIDPSQFIGDYAPEHFYSDCVHPSMPGPIPSAVANLLLNVVVNNHTVV